MKIKRIVISIYKKTMFAIKNIARIIIGEMLSLLIKRDKNIIIFNAKFGKNHEIFMHNTKYLYLQLMGIFEKHNFKIFWLCTNNNMIKHFKENGFNNVIKPYSLKGI